MPSCIHFINRKVGLGREGLTHLGGGKYRSCCWLLSKDQIRSLVGGWIYLHETKTQPSAFGGPIVAIEPGGWEHAPDQDRWAIISYLRALQLSQLGTLDDVPQELRATLKK